MRLQRIDQGFYTATVNGKIYWIMDPFRSETDKWVMSDMTGGLGYKAESNLHFDTLRDARAHLASLR